MTASKGAITPQERYAALCAAFLGRGTERAPEGKGFGASALTIGGRIFAMLTRDCLVVKLPKARVDALVEAGWGVRFDANRGRPMREWLTVDPAHAADWASLAEEALQFAQGPPIGRR